MSSATGLQVREWGQLHTSIQWVYRGKVSEDGRGRFTGNCGVAAWYFLRGTGLVRDDGGATQARRGDWLFPAMGPHERDFSRDAEILSLRFYMEWPDGQPLYSLDRSILLNGAKYPELLRTARALERAAHEGTQKNCAGPEFLLERLDFPEYAEIGSALLKWSRAMARAFAQEEIAPSLERFEDERVVRALRVLDGWPLREAFSLGQLVEITGISRAQLDRLFRTKLGQTPHHYFDRRRLRHAERSIQRPDQPIKEVAFDVGFRHVSSFSAWFKQNTGVNPNVHRAR